MSQAPYEIPFQTPEQAAVCLGDWDVISLQGPDRKSFLSGLVSNETKGLGEGTGNRSLLLTAKGRIIQELLVFSLPEQLLLLTEAGQGAELREKLDYYHIMEDLTISSETNFTPWLLYGEQLPGWFEGWSQQAFPEEGKGLSLNAENNPHAQWAIRISRLGALPALFVWSQEPQETTQHTWEQNGLSIPTPAQWQVHKSLAGWDSNARVLRDTLVHEVGLEHTHVSYTKGCFVGQEVVARTEHRGKANKALVWLTTEGDAIANGSGVAQDGNVVGTILDSLQVEGQTLYRALIKVKAQTADSPLTIEANPKQIIQFANVS
jgi:folate-binding protein YgfZ